MVAHSGSESTLSVVIPVFNEAESLEALTHELTSVLDEIGRGYEVLLVNDGSRDTSLEVLLALGERDHHLRVFDLTRNQGQSAALAVGFKHAKGEIVVTMDADLQNDPADIPRLLEVLGEFDLVSGVRRNRKDTWLRRLSSRVANRVRDAILGDSIHDVGCALKAYKSQYLEDVPVFNGMHRFLPALVKMHGARSTEIEVNHRPRRFGTSSYGVHNRLWRGIADLRGVRWLQRRSVDTLQAKEVVSWKETPSG